MNIDLSSRKKRRSQPMNSINALPHLPLYSEMRFSFFNYYQYCFLEIKTLFKWLYKIEDAHITSKRKFVLTFILKYGVIDLKNMILSEIAVGLDIAFHISPLSVAAATINLLGGRRKYFFFILHIRYFPFVCLIGLFLALIKFSFRSLYYLLRSVLHSPGYFS